MKRLNLILLCFSTLITSLSFCLINTDTNYENEVINVEKKYLDGNNVQELDVSITNTYKMNSHVLGKFTSVVKINSLDQLEKYSAIKAKPENVILYIDKEMNLVNENGETLGLSLTNAYTKYVKDKMIPLIYLSDDDVTNSFMEYYPYNMNVLDMAVVSNSSSLVKKVREVNTVIRGIVDYSDVDIKENQWFEVIKETNMSYANTLILNNESATSETIDYIQARLKTVWVEVNETSTLEVINQINNGTSGLICNNVEYIYSATNVYLNTDNQIRNLNRKPYIVSHRGIYSNYENSFEGFKEAEAKGATHIETDIQVTKDNRLVLMHDSTIDRTTTGTGAVSDYTLEELSKFRIDSSSVGVIEGEGVEIPLLDDILDYFKDSDIVLVIEFKTTNTKSVSLLRDLLEEYDAFDNVILISFYPGILAQIKEVIPEVPLSTLGSISFVDFATGLQYVNEKNSAVNTTNENQYPELTRYLIVRGFLTWHWTYSSANEVEKGMTFGVQGFTNDCVEKFENFAYKLVGEQEVELSSFDNLTLEFNLLTYSGVSQEKVSAKVIYLENHETYAYAVFSTSVDTSNGESFCIFSDVIKLVKK